MPDADRALLSNELLEKISAASSRTEAERSLSPEIATALGEAGVFSMLLPSSLGGGEAHPTTFVDTIMSLAQADGSVGWCAAIAATTAVLGAYLPREAASLIWGTDPRLATGGAFHPHGRAEKTDEGWRVSGRWPFASGCEHCSWLLGGALLFENGEPILDANGLPRARMMIFPAAAVRRHDTWHVAGLRGTGSQDIEVVDQIVTEEFSTWLDEPPRETGPLYAFPVFGLLALGIAATALGVARGAMDDLLALAASRRPVGSRRTLEERATTQAQVAQAEAAISSSRAWLGECIDECWRNACEGQTIPLSARSRLRLAATHAVRQSAAATDRLYELGGGSSIYETNRLQQRFRDIHVTTQHAMVAPATYELTGRILLGLETNAAML